MKKNFVYLKTPLIYLKVETTSKFGRSFWFIFSHIWWYGIILFFNRNCEPCFVWFEQKLIYQMFLNPLHLFMFFGLLDWIGDSHPELFTVLLGETSRLRGLCKICHFRVPVGLKGCIFMFVICRCWKCCLGKFIL